MKNLQRPKYQERFIQHSKIGCPCCGKHRVVSFYSNHTIMDEQPAAPLPNSFVPWLDASWTWLACDFVVECVSCGAVIS